MVLSMRERLAYAKGGRWCQEHILYLGSGLPSDDLLYLCRKLHMSLRLLLEGQVRLNIGVMGDR